MLRHDEWQSCAVPLVWTEFTADIIEHRVREVTSGERFSVTLFTPSHLECVSNRDWMNLESKGLPVHLYAGRAAAETGGHPDETVIDTEVSETVAHEAQVSDNVVDSSISALQTVAGRAETIDEALTQLADQSTTSCSILRDYRMFSSAACLVDS